jgi:hypothetical protein
MIRYRLICENDHEFDGWFRDSATFENQSGSGEVTCPFCGSAKIGKAPMAPSITGSTPDGASTRMMAAMRHMGEHLREFREYVTKNADYVGADFAEEARRIHDRETEERGIYGEASKSEVTELTEEGIDVLPLPTLPEDQN